MSGSETRKSAGTNWFRVIGVVLLWGGVGAAIFGSMAYLDLDLNLFDWHPTPEASTWVALGVGLLGLVAVLPLTTITDHALSVAVAWFVVVGLCIFGLYLLPAEPLSPDTLLGRDQASPLWYRGGRVVAMALPVLLLGARTLLQRRRA
ncbi:MAG: hypothetical protein P1V51_23310 [Deltaproteobacteria bacterium]|nr:hypothetical protein [Deltaproteobacteria bacterium]